MTTYIFNIFQYISVDGFYSLQKCPYQLKSDQDYRQKIAKQKKVEHAEIFLFTPTLILNNKLIHFTAYYCL